MKLTTVLLIAAFLQVSGASVAQKITYKNKQASLGQIFKEIRKQTGYNVLWSTNNIKNTRPQDVNFKDTPVQTVLDQVLKGQALTYDIEDKTVLIKERKPVAAGNGQSDVNIPVVVTGKVTDTAGTPLPGATVQIKGKPGSVVTGVDGTFNVNAQPGDQLIISYVGFSPQSIKITEGLPYQNIVLHMAANRLSDVIVSNGYELLDNGNTTGSYASVGTKMLDREVSTDIISRLEGITPSLAFDNRAVGQQSLSIRGRSTILSNNSPLIVVDNFPYEGDIHNINPNDVESVTLLRDAAAAAIWGARAGNGVIVITTKRGKFNQANNISFNSSVTIGNKPDLFYSPSFLNSSDFISVEQQLFDKGFYSADENSPSKPMLSPAVELMIAHRDGHLSTADFNKQLDDLKKQDVRNDFEKYFYRKSVMQQYSLSMYGGGEKYNYIVSGGLDNNRANLVGNSDNRYTFHTNENFRLVKNLTLGADISYTSTKNIADNPGYGAITSGNGKATIYPYAKLADAHGNPLAIAKDYPLSFSRDAESQGLLDWQYRPLQEISLAGNSVQAKDIRLKFDAKYNIMPGLSAEGLYQYENTNTSGSFFKSKDAYYTRDLINQYEQPGGQYAVPLGGIMDSQTGALSSESGRFQLNYDHTIGNAGQLTAVAGAEVRNTHTLGGMTRLYGYDKDILISQPVDYLGYYILNPAGYPAQVPYIANQSDMTDRYVSEYLSANYNYAGRYYLSASARKDASNLFGVNANQKGIPLYSFGAAWELSRESAYHVDWLPYLKLRATYGYTGNVNKSITAYTIATYNYDFFSNQPDALILTPPNPDLQWEKVRTMNFGLDFKTKNSRISGSVDYFTKKGTDQVGSVALDPTTGFFVSGRYNVVKNSSAISGHGADIEINTINTTGRVNWQTRVLFSYATDKVTDYKYDELVSSYLSSYSPPLEGKPVQGIYSYKWAGLDHNTGDPMIYLKGVPTKDYGAIASTATVNDLIYNGPALPTVFGSVMNTVNYKQFSLSANITYKFGYYFHKPSIAYSSLINNWLGNADFAKRWQKPGDETHTNVPSLSLDGNGTRDAAYNSSSALVDKGDNIRLQDIQLAYTIGHFKNSHSPFKNMTFYLYANNLGILWRANKDGLDPDYIYGFSAVKPIKNFSIGFRTHF